MLYAKDFPSAEKFNAAIDAVTGDEKLFAYIRDYFMPAHGFEMARNGAQELEVFDTSEHRSGYAYMPVVGK